MSARSWRARNSIEVLALAVEIAVAKIVTLACLSKTHGVEPGEQLSPYADENELIPS
jgi:hypothetical protein